MGTALDALGSMGTVLDAWGSMGTVLDVWESMGILGINGNHLGNLESNQLLGNCFGTWEFEIKSIGKLGNQINYFFSFCDFMVLFPWVICDFVFFMILWFYFLVILVVFVLFESFSWDLSLFGFLTLSLIL